MTTTHPVGPSAPPHPNWSAVFSLALCVTALVTAELLPVSLLTPMAASLGVTVGSAGQAVTVTSLVALLSSLFAAVIARRLDRKTVVLTFTASFTAANLVVAAAPSYAWLLMGRVLLGIALGGFWSMVAAVTMRVVPASFVAKALSIVFAGVSIAMAVASPLGTYAGVLVGWRGVFVAAGGLGIVTFVWQWLALPAIPSNGASRLSTLFRVGARPGVPLGMLGMMLAFGGHFAFFTYTRPFLENVTHLSVPGISFALLIFGVANVLGTFAFGALIEHRLRAVLVVAPLAITLASAALLAVGSSADATIMLLGVWGFAFGAIPVAWTTWVTRTVPDKTESAGGLQVAAIQVAITAGAALGGTLVDHRGPYAALLVSAAAMLFSALASFGLRTGDSS